MARDAGGRPGGGAGDGAASLDATAQWAVVAVLAVCLVAVPLVVLLRPPTFLPFHDAYMALALVPGLVLGATAVVLAVRARA